MICGDRPVASLDAARSGPAYQIDLLELSGFSPILVFPESLYRARTGRTSLDGFIRAKKARSNHFEGFRTVSTSTPSKTLRASSVHSATSKLAAVNRGHKRSSPATEGYSEVVSQTTIGTS